MVTLTRGESRKCTEQGGKDGMRHRMCEYDHADLGQQEGSVYKSMRS